MEPQSSQQFQRQQPDTTTLPSFADLKSSGWKYEGSSLDARPRACARPPLVAPLYHGQPAQYSTPSISGISTAQKYFCSDASINYGLSMLPSSAHDDHVPDSSSPSRETRDSSFHLSGSTPSSADRVSSSRNMRIYETSRSGRSSSGRKTKRASLPSCQSADFEGQKTRPQEEKKVLKEKTAREQQAKSFQNMEDLLEAVGWHSSKHQTPGNRKKSGLHWDKQDTLDATFVMLDLCMQRIAKSGDLNAFLAASKPIINSHITGGSPQDLFARSLLATSFNSRKRVCTDNPSHEACDDSIRCRKATRHMNCDANLCRISCVSGHQDLSSGHPSMDRVFRA